MAASITMRGNVFSAETLAENQSIRVPQGSMLATAIKAIRQLVVGNNLWIGDLRTMQTIALNQYEITYEAEEEGGVPKKDDSFIVTMNGKSLIIKHPNGSTQINMSNALDYDRVSTRVIDPRDLQGPDRAPARSTVKGCCAVM